MTDSTFAILGSTMPSSSQQAPRRHSVCAVGYSAGLSSQLSRFSTDSAAPSGLRPDDTGGEHTPKAASSAGKRKLRRFLNLPSSLFGRRPADGAQPKQASLTPPLPPSRTANPVPGPRTSSSRQLHKPQPETAVQQEPAGQNNVAPHAAPERQSLAFVELSAPVQQKAHPQSSLVQPSSSAFALATPLPTTSPPTVQQVQPLEGQPSATAPQAVASRLGVVPPRSVFDSQSAAVKVVPADGSCPPVPPPGTPDVRENPIRQEAADSIPDSNGSLTRNSSSSSSVKTAKEALEKLIAGEALVVPAQPVKHRVVAEALSSDVSSDSEGEVQHVSLSALSPSQLEDALPSASQSQSQRQIARYTRSRLALLDMQAAPSGFQALDKLAATFEASVADGSVDSDPDNDDSVSILDVADSAELERISIAAASEFGPPVSPLPSKANPAPSGARLAAKLAAKHRPAQDSASEIQPDTSPESTYREPSLRKQQPPGIAAAKAALMQLSADLPKTGPGKPAAKATAAWQNPRAAARRKTAMDAWWASEARQDFILRTSPEFARPPQRQHCPSVRLATQELPPSSARSMHQQAQKGKAPAPAKGSETKKWAGLGQTAAALAQLEWQNRKLAQDAGRAHERALEAEAKVAEMAKVEQLCTQLSQDNDRLLKRLLRLVSPAEAERLQGKESNLEQKVVNLAEENSRLHSENALLLEEVEALKLEAERWHSEAAAPVGMQTL